MARSWNRWLGTMSRKCCGVVELAASRRLPSRHDDLHMTDMVAVPERFETPLAKRSTGMFCTVSAEEMIDPIDLVFAQNFQICALSARAEARSWPNGFSMITRRQAPLLWRARSARPRCSMMGPKNLSATAR